MKKIGVKGLVIAVILVVIGLSAVLGLSDNDAFDSSVYDASNSSSQQSRYEVEDINMSVDYSGRLGYSVDIKGSLKNKTSRELSYVSVTFAIYDKDGNQIATARDNMNYLQAGKTWTFNASMIGWTEVEPSSCQLVEVDAW